MEKRWLTCCGVSLRIDHVRFEDGPPRTCEFVFRCPRCGREGTRDRFEKAENAILEKWLALSRLHLSLLHRRRVA